MTAVFKQRGDAVDYIPPADVNAGDVVVQHDLVGIAKLDIKAGERGALAVTGVYSVPRVSGPGTAMEAGMKLYWLQVDKKATLDADDGSTPPISYPYLGKCILTAEDDDETVLVRLDQ